MIIEKDLEKETKKSKKKDLMQELKLLKVAKIQIKERKKMELFIILLIIYLRIMIAFFMILY